MLNIIVCMKAIIDPEIPFSMFKLDRKNLKPIPPSGMPPVFSPFDENALEGALKIRESQDCRITALSLGMSIPRSLMQKVLALGADEVIGLEGDEFENLDPFNTSRALAAAIRKIGEYDLIFTGRQAGDWDAGLVWAGIAESLDLPSVTIARSVEIQEGKVIVERCVSDGIETLESDPPLLVTFSNEAGELRNISLAALTKVKRKEIPKWSGSDVGFERMDILEVQDLFEPDLEKVDCFFIKGESPYERGENLAKKLYEEDFLQRIT